jgi:hypothetical protein
VGAGGGWAFVKGCRFFCPTTGAALTGGSPIRITAATRIQIENNSIDDGTTGTVRARGLPYISVPHAGDALPIQLLIRGNECPVDGTPGSATNAVIDVRLATAGAPCYAPRIESNQVMFAATHTAVAGQIGIAFRSGAAVCYGVRVDGNIIHVENTVGAGLKGIRVESGWGGAEALQKVFVVGNTVDLEAYGNVDGLAGVNIDGVAHSVVMGNVLLMDSLWDGVTETKNAVEYDGATYGLVIGNHLKGRYPVAIENVVDYTYVIGNITQQSGNAGEIDNDDVNDLFGDNKVT